MPLQEVMLFASQILTLIVKLVDEVKKGAAINETDTEALKKSVAEMREKVAAIKWED